MSTINMRSNERTVIENFVLQNNNLSLAAKGLMALLLSDPSMQVKDLHKYCSEELEDILPIVQELEEHNYIEAD